VIVEFEIDLPENRTITEQDLRQRFDELKGELSKLENSPYGSLLFRDPKRGQEAGLYDTLEYLLANVCMSALPKLRAGEEVVVDSFSSAERVRLTPEGSDVVLSVDGAVKARFAREDLLPALLDSATRYAAYLRRLYEVDPKWAIPLSMFEAALHDARGEASA
jgi:hypothetical protein